MKPPHHHPDRELLARIVAGDEQAFTVLFNTHWDAVFSTALVLLKSWAVAEDISQDVFFKLWQGRAKAMEIENLDAYLFTATRNKVFNHLRHLKVREAYGQYLSSEPALHAIPGAERLAEYKELKQEIEAAIAQLPPQQQMAFRLSREKGMSHAEIAMEMNIGQKTVKDYIVKALVHLRKTLQQAALLLALYLGYGY